MDGDRDFGILAAIGLRTQPVADDLLEPADRGLRPRSFVEAGYLLPTEAPASGDTTKITVARRRIGLGSSTRNSRGARRHNKALSR
jgi:hypothetical protein